MVTVLCAEVDAAFRRYWGWLSKARFS